MVNFVVRECLRLGCYQLCPVAVIMSFTCTQFNQSLFICLFIYMYIIFFFFESKDLILESMRFWSHKIYS